MKGILTLARHNKKIFFKSPFFIFLLVGPILITLFCNTILGNQTASEGITLVAYEKEPTSYGGIFQEELALRGIGFIKVGSYQMLVQKLEDGKGQIGIVLTADPRACELVIGEDNPLLDYNKNQIQNTLSIVGAGQSTIRPIQIKIDEQSDTSVMLSSFGIFVMLFLFTCIKSLQPMIRERETLVYERIISSGIRHHEYILGHAWGCFQILILQALIQCLSMYMIGQNFNLSFIQLFLLSSVMAIIGIAIGLVIYTFIHSSQAYIIAATFVITPLCMLSNCIFPIDFLPYTIQRISYLSPLRWLMQAYEQMLLMSSWIEIIRPLGIALLIGCVMILGTLVWWKNQKTYQKRYL